MRCSAHNEIRTHLALGKDAPTRSELGGGVAVSSFTFPCAFRKSYPDAPLGRAVQRTGVIVAIPILSGLHHHYGPAAGRRNTFTASYSR
jgi:hypothetical protein